ARQVGGGGVLLGGERRHRRGAVASEVVVEVAQVERLDVCPTGGAFPVDDRVEHAELVRELELATCRLQLSVTVLSDEVEQAARVEVGELDGNGCGDLGHVLIPPVTPDTMGVAECGLEVHGRGAEGRWLLAASPGDRQGPHARFVVEEFGAAHRPRRRPRRPERPRPRRTRAKTDRAPGMAPTCSPQDLSWSFSTTLAMSAGVASTESGSAAASMELSGSGSSTGAG